MQDGGWGKIVQLEAIILQKPSEKWVNGKSHAPRQIEDEAHSFSRRRIGEILCLGFAFEGGQSCSNRDQICRREKPLRLQLLQLAMRYGTPLPLAFLWARTGGGAGDASHVGMAFPSNL